MKTKREPTILSKGEPGFVRTSGTLHFIGETTVRWNLAKDCHESRGGGERKFPPSGDHLEAVWA